MDGFRLALVAGVVLALVAAPTTGAAAPEVATGGGVVLASSNLCAHPPAPAVVTLTLSSVGGGTWTVAVEGSTAIGCPVSYAGTCTGAGSLSLGIDIGGCSPLSGTGRLGPLVQVLLCPSEVCESALRGPFQFAFALGTYDGEVVLLAPPA